jgi:hypothetical protein
MKELYMNPLSMRSVLDDYSMCEKSLQLLEYVLKLSSKETEAIRNKMEELKSK